MTAELRPPMRALEFAEIGALQELAHAIASQHMRAVERAPVARDVYLESLAAVFRAQPAGVEISLSWHDADSHADQNLAETAG